MGRTSPLPPFGTRAQTLSCRFTSQSDNCWDWCSDRAHRRVSRSVFSASELVGRPGLDPGTLGLKVLNKSWRRGPPCHSVSQICWWDAPSSGFAATGWNGVRRTETQWLGPGPQRTPQTYCDCQPTRAGRLSNPPMSVSGSAWGCLQRSSPTTGSTHSST